MALQGSPDILLSLSFLCPGACLTPFGNGISSGVEHPGVYTHRPSWEWRGMLGMTGAGMG